MKRWFLVVSGIIAALPLISGQSSITRKRRSETATAELLRSTEEISLASERRDAATLDQLMAEDFVMLLADGRTFTKAQMIEMSTRSNSSVTASSHTISDPHAYVYGDTAIVVTTIADPWRDTNGDHVYQERIFGV